MSRRTGDFVAEVPSFEIADGVVHMEAGECSIFMPLPIFRRSTVRASRVLANHDAQKAQVVPIRKKRPP